MVGMDIPFDWSILSPMERGRRCRDLAAEALETAERKPAGSREQYLRRAAEWLKLAKEIKTTAPNFKDNTSAKALGKPGAFAFCDGIVCAPPWMSGTRAGLLSWERLGD